MTVRFFRLNTTTAAVEHVGTLTLTEGRIVADPPDSIALNGILDEPLEVNHEDRPRTLIDPMQEPDAFLQALPTMYHGTYFWAKKVED